MSFQPTNQFNSAQLANRARTRRHVAKTDEIKDFVVIEEGSIAKGIRRIVAVTSTEAHEVSRIAAEFTKRLDWIETLEGKDKETALKQYLVVSHARSSCG